MFNSVDFVEFDKIDRVEFDFVSSMGQKPRVYRKYHNFWLTYTLSTKKQSKIIFSIILFSTGEML